MLFRNKNVCAFQHRSFLDDFDRFCEIGESAFYSEELTNCVFRESSLQGSGQSSGGLITTPTVKYIAPAIGSATLGTIDGTKVGITYPISTVPAVVEPITTTTTTTITYAFGSVASIYIYYRKTTSFNWIKYSTLINGIATPTALPGTGYTCYFFDKPSKWPNATNLINYTFTFPEGLLKPGTEYECQIEYTTNSNRENPEYNKKFTFRQTDSVKFKTGSGPPAIALPTLTTISASQITQTSVVSGGNITADGGASVSERGIVYGTQPNPISNKTKNGSGTGTYNVSLSGLQPNTTYYIRAYAINTAGTAYGDQKSFKTLAMPTYTSAQIKTGAVGQITTNSAFCSVTLNFIGNTSVTETGIVWGTSDSNLTTVSNVGIYTNSTAFDSNTSVPKDITNYPITGLSVKTKYYVKAYAKNTAGIVYGTSKIFTTFDQLGPGEYRLPTDGVTWYQLYENWERVISSTTNTKKPFLRVKNIARKDIVHPVSYYFNATFNSNRNYQFRTTVEEFYDTHYNGYVGRSNGASFSMITPWGEYFSFPVPYFHVSNNLPNLSPINLYFYASLPEKDSTTYTFDSKTSKSESETAAQNPITYVANHLFGISNSGDLQSEGLCEVKLNELSWKIQGFSFFTFNISSEKQDSFINENENLFGGKGWHYNQISKYEYTFTWFDRHSSLPPVSVRPNYSATETVQISENDKNNPVGGEYGNKVSHSTYRANNYIAKYIPYQNFNLSFKYKSERADIGIRIYISPVLPKSTGSEDIIPKDATLILAMTQSRSESSGEMVYGLEQDCAFVGLEGNQYLYIVGDTVGTASSTYSISTITGLRISGGYHSGNNKKYTVDSKSGISYPIFTSAAYSTLIGSGNNITFADSTTIKEITAKIGNGIFNSGIWENGVWNSGWREDFGIREFYKVEKFFSMNRDKKWRVSISGPASSLYPFSTGDKVAISNIVAIDLNEGRNLLKRHFSIVEKNETEITVEFENEFPLRRIEIDSNEHRILVTKNIWLSGTFFNGYFKGIWNYGLFAGYPFLTKMEDSHWIDGIFTGGHFYAEKYNMTFSQAIKSEYSNANRLGLTFSSPHRLAVGDIVTIRVIQASRNSEIDLGETIIVSVPNQYNLITGIAWKKEYEAEVLTGVVYTIISSGLIQNFDLRSNNVSKMTSMQSMNSPMVFSYNSWIDVNYSNKSAVNIGRPQFSLDEVSGKNYAENNLYGYVTTDVLSSKSSFRDSFSNAVRNYKLGIKYKIFSDYVGDSSKFDEYFDSTDTETGLETFKGQGWEFSKITGSYLTFSRTKEPLDASTTTIGKELYVYAKGKGGVLNLSTAYDIPNRTNGEVDRSRYTLVEFDLVTYSVASDAYVDLSNDMSTQAPIHFGNLNYVTRNGKDGLPKKVPATYLPIYENANHLTTGDIKKQEFFFNKRNLMMNFRGTGNLGDSAAEYYIDGLKLYEVDMVPFFQYFKNNNINKSIQNPYQAIAPVIDYNDDISDAQILSDYIENIENISYKNGINWVEDIILNRYQITSNEFDTDTEDITIEQGDQVIIPKPAVTTIDVIEIGSRTAKLKGEVTAGGGTTERGVVWGESQTPTISDNSNQATGYGNGQFEAEIYDLTPAKTYYTRAYAQNEAHPIEYGIVKSFKTNSMPTIVTYEASNISNTTATFGGEIYDIIDAINAYGIAYGPGTDQNSAAKIANSVALPANGIFSMKISSLLKSTTYYAWVYVKVGNIFAYGNRVEFTTSSMENPSVTTTVPSDIGGYLQSGGVITSDGGGAIIDCGIFYGTSIGDINIAINLPTPVQSGSFNSIISDPMPGNTYFIKAYATNAVGTAYGEVKTYTYPAKIPTVITGSNTDPASGVGIYENQITSNGGSNITQCGIVYGTSTSPTITGSKSSLATAIQSGPFDIEITGLTRLTTYYMRAYATNAVGTAYGTEISFTTPAEVPKLITSIITDIHILREGENVVIEDFTPGAGYGTATYSIGNINYAKSGGKITDDGGSPILEIGLLWTPLENGEPTTENSIYYVNAIAMYLNSRLVVDPANPSNNELYGFNEDEVLDGSWTKYVFNKGGYYYYKGITSSNFDADGKAIIYGASDPKDIYDINDKKYTGGKYIFSYNILYAESTQLKYKGLLGHDWQFHAVQKDLEDRLAICIPYMLYRDQSSEALEYKQESSISGGITYGKNGNIEFGPFDADYGSRKLKNPINGSGYEWVSTMTGLKNKSASFTGAYNVRAYARNSVGIGYGNIQTTYFDVQFAVTSANNTNVPGPDPNNGNNNNNNNSNTLGNTND